MRLPRSGLNMPRSLYPSIDWVVRPGIHAFLSTFTYPIAPRRHVEATGVTGDYTGAVGFTALRFDLDADGDLDAALCDTRVNVLPSALPGRHAA
jgi:hypothetical protein